MLHSAFGADERRAGVVVRENVGVAAALRRHDVRAVLAHADAVAAAGDGEGEYPAAVCDGKRRRAQGKERAHLRARECLRADRDARHAAAVIEHRRAEPRARIVAEHTVRITLKHGIMHGVGCDLGRGDVVWHVLRRLRGGHAHKIRRIAAPECSTALGRPGGRGVKHRTDELPVVDEILPVRVGDGLPDARHVARIILAPLRAQRRIVLVRAAAGVLVADTGLRMVCAAAAHAPEDVGARGDGLCPQRLGREGGGHLGGYHAGQPVGHGRFDECIAAQRRDGRCAVGRDGIRHRHGRDGQGSRSTGGSECDRDPWDQQRQRYEQQRQQKNPAHPHRLLSAARGVLRLDAAGKSV